MKKKRSREEIKRSLLIKKKQKTNELRKKLIPEYESFYERDIRRKEPYGTTKREVGLGKRKAVMIRGVMSVSKV